LSPSRITAKGTGGTEFVTLLRITPPTGLVTTIDFGVDVQTVELIGLKKPRLHTHWKSVVSCSKTPHVIKVHPVVDGLYPALQMHPELSEFGCWKRVAGQLGTQTSGVVVVLVEVLVDVAFEMKPDAHAQ